MKRTSLKIIVLTGLCFCWAGCHHGAGDHGQADHADHGTGHEDHGAGAQLVLNDGAKWQVDEPTRESATKLGQLAKSAQTLHSVEDARVLGDVLDQELDTLVKNCKMTGPAHDQLHVFLLALFPQVEALKEKSDVEELQQARAEIGDLLEAYDAHFE